MKANGKVSDLKKAVFESKLKVPTGIIGTWHPSRVKTKKMKKIEMKEDNLALHDYGI